MKKCVLSAIAGALVMLVTILIAANIIVAHNQKPSEYEHIDFVSSITSADCFVCSE